MEIIRGGFGKLPSQPEFVRVNAGGREVIALDQWVQEGLYHLRRDFGAQWEEIYDHKLLHRFVYRADNCGHTLTGVIRAAMDAVERRFPFVCFGILPTQFVDQNPLLLPTLNDPFFVDFESTILEAAGMAQLTPLKNRLQQESILPSLSAVLEDRYKTFVDEVEIGELGYFGKTGVIPMLQEFITTLSGAHTHPRRFTDAIELPLEQSPYARGLEIRFWLELTMILLQWYPPTFTYSWPTGDPPPRTATLTILFRQPPGHLMRALLAESDLSRGVWRPGVQKVFPGGGGSRGLPVPPLREDRTLRSLLTALSPGYPSSCRWYQPAQGGR